MLRAEINDSLETHMKDACRTLDARAFGLSAGLIAAALTTLCAIALAIAPNGTTTVASTLLHLDLTGMSRSLDWGVYFAALFGWGFGAGVIFWAAAALYNNFARGESPEPARQGSLAAR